LTKLRVLLTAQQSRAEARPTAWIPR